MLHNRPLCHLSEIQPPVGRDHLVENTVGGRALPNCQRGQQGLAGGGGFGRLRFFALRDFHVGGFDFCDGIQAAAELTAVSTEVPPFRVPRPSLGSDSVSASTFHPLSIRERDSYPRDRRLPRG